MISATPILKSDTRQSTANAPETTGRRAPASDDFIPFLKATGRGEKLKRDLTYKEAANAMELIVRRKATDAQIGGFLIAQRVKGESVDEIRGFTNRLRRAFVRPLSPRVDNLLDLAVPYDGKVKTAQIAPAIAVILAEAGVPVLLHGASKVPTKFGVGPASVLNHLGCNAEVTLRQAERQIERAGFAYIDAKQFAPLWHDLTPIRSQFGLRTVCNTVEKFLNPADAPFQVSGFYHGNYIRRIQSAQTGSRRSWMVQGEEGSVETPPGRRTPIFGETEQENLVIEPARHDLGERSRLKLEAHPISHAHVNQKILHGQPGAASDQAALSAAVILCLLGATPDLGAGLTVVRRILTSGAAMRRLDLARSRR
jgi:anthranilate phosphoribosyltransferase